ncbi:unnamed protein product [Linum tenue]|uniref:Uncharacterized protein n=1 Tax=Linum tenue TaxID=586396 RepID=A0AAV0Q520_9ROSI|nr:unnamed protein product [Linum tenue]
MDVDANEFPHYSKVVCPPSLSRSDAVLLSRLATSGFATVVLDSRSGLRSEVKDHDTVVWDCYANAVEAEKTRTIQSIISTL